MNKIKKEEVQSVPVSERALITRINRRLSHKGQILKTTRGAQAKADLGKYYVADVERNIMMFHHVNLVPLARELGAMQAWEAIA